jgi:hypothetical protein
MVWHNQSDSDLHCRPPRRASLRQRLHAALHRNGNGSCDAWSHDGECGIGVLLHLFESVHFMGAVTRFRRVPNTSTVHTWLTLRTAVAGCVATIGAGVSESSSCVPI